MFASKALRESRANLLPRFNELRDKAHTDDGFSDEDRKGWEDINKDYNALTEKITVAERTEAVEASIPDDRELGGLPKDQKRDELGRDDKDGNITDETRALAFVGWHHQQLTGECSERSQAAAKLIGVKLDSKDYPITMYREAPKTIADIEKRFQTAGTDTEGGFTVPTGFVNRLEVALLSFSAVRQAGAEILRTDTGNDIEWPTLDDTGNIGTVEGEGDALAETALVFAQFVLNAYIVSSDIVRSSVSLIEDNAVNLVNMMGDILGERVARKEAALNTTGTGTGEANGIVTASTLGTTTAVAGDITDDELLDLLHSVDPAYRQDPTFGWMMHDNIALYLRKLKDGNSNYIWEPGLKANQPDVLHGKPVHINQQMQSSVATATKTILCGAFSKYKIREVRVGRYRRLVERYAEFDQEGFVFVRRSDADLLNGGTNPVKHMLQA